MPDEDEKKRQDTASHLLYTCSMGRLKKTESFGIASALLALIMAFTLFSCDTSKTVHHTVTFDLDGGRFTDESQETIQVIHGATIDKPSDPVKDPTASYRYTFAGWYSDEARSIPYSFASAITSDATIYAKWNAHSRVTYRTVTFDLSKINDETDLAITLKDGSEARITVTSGSTVEKPEYSLAFNDIPFSPDNVEWVTEDGDVFDFSNGITADITLYARLTGTLKDSNEAYLAYDAESFLDWMEETQSKASRYNCILVSDIDLEGVTQLPTMSLGNSFDGNGHVISNLSAPFIFSEIQKNGVVKDLGIVDMVLTSGTGSRFGAITGTNYGRIENCYVTGNSSISTGDVSAQEAAYIGGICGYNDSYGVIVGCYVTENSSISTGDVSASAAAYVGGICGFNEGKIENCYVTGNSSISTGDVSASAAAYVGGICGYNDSYGVIVGCYVTENSSISTGDVSASAAAYVGGICGFNEGKIENCYVTGNSSISTGDVSASAAAYVGGICGGNNGGKIIGCYVTEGSSISASTESGAQAYAGGICGDNDSYGVIVGCYSTATVMAESAIAGILCGRNLSGSIEYCGYSGAGNPIGSGVAGNNISKATKPEDWEKIADKMNTAISGTGFKYAKNVNGGTDYPLVLQKIE